MPLLYKRMREPVGVAFELFKNPDVAGYAHAEILNNYLCHLKGSPTPPVELVDGEACWSYLATGANVSATVVNEFINFSLTLSCLREYELENNSFQDSFQKTFSLIITKDNRMGGYIAFDNRKCFSARPADRNWCHCLNCVNYGKDYCYFLFKENNNKLIASNKGLFADIEVRIEGMHSDKHLFNLNKIENRLVYQGFTMLDEWCSEYLKGIGYKIGLTNAFDVYQLIDQQLVNISLNGEDEPRTNIMTFFLMTFELLKQKPLTTQKFKEYVKTLKYYLHNKYSQDSSLSKHIMESFENYDYHNQDGHDIGVEDFFDTYIEPILIPS